MNSLEIALNFVRNRKFSRFCALTPLVLVVAVALANFPFFFKVHFPLHDALAYMQVFKYYYSNLLFHHEPPLWVPHIGYGTPFDPFGVSALGPSQFLVAGIGLLFGWSNIQILFMLGLSLDMYFSAFGLYLLAREAGAARVSSLCVAIASIATMFPDVQLDFNLKIIVPLPICMYLILRFVRTFDMRLLFASGTILLTFGYGTAIYLIVVQFYVLAFWLVAVWLAAGERPSLYPLLQRIAITSLRPTSLAFFSAAILAMIGLWYAIRLTSTEMQLLPPGRDPVTGGVTLWTFLSYGGNTTANKIVEMFTGLPMTRDLRFFPGLIGLSLAVYAVIMCRAQVIVWPALATFAVVLAFSMPKLAPIASLSYLLPGMSLVRHVGYVPNLANPSLFVLAAISLTDMASRFDSDRRAIYLRCLGVILPASAFAASFAGRSLWGPIVQWPPGAAIVFLCGVLVCAHRLFRSFEKDSHTGATRASFGLIALIATILLVPPVSSSSKSPNAASVFGVTFPWVWVSTTVCLLVVWSTLSRWKTSATAAFATVLAAGALELALHRGLILYGSPSFNVAAERTAVAAEPLQWRSERRYDSEWPIVSQVFGGVSSIQSTTYSFRNAFLNVDNCNLSRQDVLVRGLVDLRLARDTGLTLDGMIPGSVDLSQYVTNFLPPDDEPFARAIGCHSPKLQILRDPTFASAQEAAARIKIRVGTASSAGTLPRIDVCPIVDGPISSGSSVDACIPAEAASATVVAFSPNRLIVDVSNPYTTDAWLVYLDAFTPRWRAEIDHVATEILRSNLAFKSVKIPPGGHRIGFFLDDARHKVSAIVLAIALGLVAAALLLFSCVIGFSAKRKTATLPDAA